MLEWKSNYLLACFGQRLVWKLLYFCKEIHSRQLQTLFFILILFVLLRRKTFVIYCIDELEGSELWNKDSAASTCTLNNCTRVCSCLIFLFLFAKPWQSISVGSVGEKRLPETWCNFSKGETYVESWTTKQYWGANSCAVSHMTGYSVGSAVLLTGLWRMGCVGEERMKKCLKLLKYRLHLVYGSMEGMLFCF